MISAERHKIKTAQQAVGGRKDTFFSHSKFIEYFNFPSVSPCGKDNKQTNKKWKKIVHNKSSP